MSTLALPLNYHERARILGSSTLYEASHLACAVDSGIRPIWDGAFIAAPAYPLQCAPGDNLALHLALEQVPRGSVLVVGTGSGYQAAILADVKPSHGRLDVFTVERIGSLLRQARKRFRQLGMNIRSKHADGHAGWAEHGPFDAIVVTAAAAAPELVDELVGQLAIGGRLVAPVGAANGQTLLQLTRQADGSIVREELAPVSFVPLLPGMLD